MRAPVAAIHSIETPASWVRLAAAVALSTIGGVGMWSVVVALPAVQAEFGAIRSVASLPYTMTMIGFALGGVLMGRLADRFTVTRPLLIGAVSLAVGYGLCGFVTALWQFILLQGLFIGLLGSSASFGPLIADTSRWFDRRRGIAVALCASGNYLAGAFWPKVVQHFIETVGWRATHVGIGLFCLVTMLPLTLLMRARPPAPILPAVASAALPAARLARLGLRPRLLQGLLFVAGLGCCVAMSMPQVHIVAYCGDLGYGAARGAEMLALMLACGIISRIASGFVADRIGGLATLLIGAVLQGVALMLYLFFDGVVALYLISALFGLFQGGIVPSYAIIVREFFPEKEAGARIGGVLMATLFGMALGGWMSGVIFDLTGSYRAAFFNGVVWNLLNVPSCRC